MMFPTLSKTRLREDLRALRHLPAGTWLPQPATQEERELLAELLRLPDDEDPLRWLPAERGPLMARVALWEMLQLLERRVVGLQRGVARRGWAIPEGEQAVFGDLLRLPPDAEPFALLNTDATPSPELLRSILKQLRTIRDAPPGTLPREPARDEQQALLQALLQLPGEVDPLRWLQAEHSDAVAGATLGRLIEQCRPTRTAHIGALMRIRRPGRVVRIPRGVRIAIKELILGEEGFTLSASLRLTPPSAMLPIWGDRLMLAWSGFNRVVDDRGHHYLLRHYEMGVSTQLWWLRERLRMTFYPAVAPQATALSFTSSPAVLRVSVIPRQTHRLLDLPDRTAGDLVWRVNVPVTGSRRIRRSS